MYHRFNENKYPSTNIKMDIFVKHMQLIKLNYEFIHPKDFQNSFDIPKNKKILVTMMHFNHFMIRLAFLKENKIPFVLFVSTEPVGNKGT